jgi:hypothetical protein
MAGDNGFGIWDFKREGVCFSLYCRLVDGEIDGAGFPFPLLGFDPRALPAPRSFGSESIVWKI